MSRTKITRRAALGALASISATGAAGAAFAAGQPSTPENGSRALAASSGPELSCDKLERLAEETAAALDEWIDGWASTRPDARRPIWHARIWPASSGRGHVLISDSALRPGPDGPNDARLAELEAAWIENDREWNRRLKAVTAAQDAGENIEAAEAAADLLAAEDVKFVDEIMATPADTLHGVMVKMRMPNHIGCRIEELLPSVAADIERIAGRVS